MSQKEQEEGLKQLGELGIPCETDEFLVRITHGDLTATQLFLQAGMSIHTKNAKGFSLLMLAAKSGHAEVVKVLIERGASVDHTEPLEGKTALMLAAERGLTEIVEILLGNGANVDRKEKTFGYTALDYAASSGRTEAAQVLIE